jgi:hypothetical protein
MMQVLGTDDLLAASAKYNWAFNSSIIHTRIPATDWAAVVPPERAAYATHDALDLLSRLLRYASPSTAGSDIQSLF